MPPIHQGRIVTRMSHKLSWYYVRNFLLLVPIIVCVYCLLYLDRGNVTNFATRSDPRTIKMYKQWQDCMIGNLGSYRSITKSTEMWKNMAKTIAICEKVDEIRNLKILDIPNNDEVKRHILPLEQTPSTIVTLGVGHDTKAEESIKPKLPPNSKFFGADPIVEVNEGLYSKVGSFFPFAVGAKPGMLQASVYVNKNYIAKTVATIDLVYFLKKVIGLTFFDSLWIDAENAEYDMLPFFDDGGELDKNDITVCQFNLELHSPNDAMKQKAHSFFWKILDDGRYGIFRAVDIGHMRLFLFNFRDPKCVSTYLFKEKE